MDISTLTIDQIKALGFDELAKIEQSQQNLRLIQAELQRRSQPEAKAENRATSPAEENQEETPDATTGV